MVEHGKTSWRIALIRFDLIIIKEWYKMPAIEKVFGVMVLLFSVLIISDILSQNNVERLNMLCWVQE